MSSPLKQNTTTIQNLLNTINSLPDAGTDLPELSNEGSSAELFAGKELIDGNGEKVTGTFTIDSELSTQDNLISQIQTALQNKASATGEDVTSETSAYTAKLATLETAITALETELQGKASGGSGGELETCTITTNGLQNIYIAATIISETGKIDGLVSKAFDDSTILGYKFLKGSTIVFLDNRWVSVPAGITATGASPMGYYMEKGAAVFVLTSDTATFTFTS